MCPKISCVQVTDNFSSPTTVVSSTENYRYCCVLLLCGFSAAAIVLTLSGTGALLTMYMSSLGTKLVHVWDFCTNDTERGQFAILEV